MPAAARRTRLALTAAAGALLLTPLLGACSAVDTALDCVKTADAIADSVTDLQQAVDNANDDPLDADKEIGDIDRNLDAIKDRTDNADIGKAVDHLRDAVSEIRTDIDHGDHTPDLSSATEAAGELTKVCSP